MQITSGRGPAECCRVVALVLEKILKQAAAKGVKTEIVERETGPLNRTLLSAVISLQGGDYHALIEDWEGTVRLPKVRTAFIINGRTGLSVCRPSRSPKAKRLQKRKSVMRLCGHPVRAVST